MRGVCAVSRGWRKAAAGAALVAGAAAGAGMAATFGARALPAAEGPLEPSVQNEVDRAVELGEKWLAGRGAETNRAEGLWFGTNGMGKAELAVRLVSEQRRGGWWVTETNGAPTRAAVKILKGM